jgi:hypothetical protein
MSPYASNGLLPAMNNMIVAAMKLNVIAPTGAASAIRRRRWVESAAVDGDGVILGSGSMSPVTVPLLSCSCRVLEE